MNLTNSKPLLLDACCGPRSFWYDRKDNRCVFNDIRKAQYVIDVNTPSTAGRKPIVIKPDIQSDFQNLPFKSNIFDLVILDPPHIVRKSISGVITKRYGILKKEWEPLIRKGFDECIRVLKPKKILIFKWSDVEIPLRKVLDILDYDPLFGNRSRKNNKTSWTVFIKDSLGYKIDFDFVSFYNDVKKIKKGE